LNQNNVLRDESGNTYELASEELDSDVSSVLFKATVPSGSLKKFNGYATFRINKIR